MAAPIEGNSNRSGRHLTTVFWIMTLAALGGLAAWFNDGTLTLSSVMGALLPALCLSTGYQAVFWLRYPARHADGSYHWRSLLAIVFTFGLLGGVLLGFMLWLLALAISALVASLPAAWGGEWARALVGCVFGAMIGAAVARSSAASRLPSETSTHQEQHSAGDDAHAASDRNVG